MTPESLMAVQMVPLVLIAWANHGVDRKGTEFVLSKAKRFGVREPSDAHALLDHWLRHRPPVIALTLGGDSFDMS